MGIPLSSNIEEYSLQMLGNLCMHSKYELQWNTDLPGLVNEKKEPLQIANGAKAEIHMVFRYWYKILICVHVTPNNPISYLMHTWAKSCEKEISGTCFQFWAGSHTRQGGWQRRGGWAESRRSQWQALSLVSPFWIVIMVRMALTIMITIVIVSIVIMMIIALSPVPPRAEAWQGGRWQGLRAGRGSDTGWLASKSPSVMMSGQRQGWDF